jgi:type 1 fimbria pilin
MEAAPQIGAVSPMSGEGRSQAFRVVASHPAGATAIVDLQVLIDEQMTPTGSTACWIDVNPLKSVAVRKEDGSDWLPSVRIGSAGTAVNSQCSINAGGVKVETKGTELAVTLPVTFAAAFTGAKKVWVVASGPRKHSGWQERGTWTVN